jgi:LacI family transcriptional regulator
MRDVAQKAGVSIKTVSRVVNNQGEIADTTRRRVLKVIKELGYRPNLVARGLVTQRTNTVGLVIPDITNPFFPEVARGVQDLAQAKDYNVFICNTDENPQEDLNTLHSLTAQAVDGIIIFSSLVTDENLDTFANSYRPIVTINRRFSHTGVSQVDVDNYRGATLAMEHLIERGHTAIGMLTGLSSSPQEVRRVKGYYDTLAEHNLLINKDWIVPGSPTMADGYQAARKLLTEHPQITALFAYNDLLALGTLRACYDLGRSVPDNCAIVGFDDIQLAAMVTPALTSVHYDKYGLGRQAMARLLEMIDSPEREFPTINVDVELVVREST